jgi:hypothetical protein
MHTPRLALDLSGLAPGWAATTVEWADALSDDLNGARQPSRVEMGSEIITQMRPRAEEQPIRAELARAQSPPAQSLGLP